MQAPDFPLMLDLQGAPARQPALQDHDFLPGTRAANSNQSSVFVEELDERGALAIEGQWRMLEARALEGNPFFSPDFLLSAARHFREAVTPRFLAIWQPLTPPHPPRLIGLIPLLRRPSGFGHGTLRTWRHPFIGFGAPLLDRFDAEAALAGALAYVTSQNTDISSICFDQLDADGPVRTLLNRLVAARGGDCAILARSRRAILTSTSQGAFGSRKNTKELARLHRRLAETGSLCFSVVETYADIRAATEDFLALEAAGWKGRNGTALVQDPDSSNFTRSMLWSAARRGRVRIARLDQDGRMIAAVIVLTSGDRAVLWKTTYDESLSRYAPGVLLFQDLGHWLRQQDDIAMTDSCASEGHEMIESLWAERMSVCDVLVSLRSARSPRFIASLARERLGRSLRNRLRRAYHAVVD